MTINLPEQGLFSNKDLFVLLKAVTEMRGNSASLFKVAMLVQRLCFFCYALLYFFGCFVFCGT